MPSRKPAMALPKSVLKRWKNVRQKDNEEEAYWSEVKARQKRQRTEEFNKSLLAKRKEGTDDVLEVKDKNGEEVGADKELDNESVKSGDESVEATVHVEEEDKQTVDEEIDNEVPAISSTGLKETDKADKKIIAEKKSAEHVFIPRVPKKKLKQKKKRKRVNA